MTSSDDYSDLMAAVAQDRDRAAFERLFDHFAPRLNSYYQRLGLDPSASEELVQDVMATLWPGKEGLDLFDKKIANRIERLPGFLGFKGLTERVAPIVQM